MEFLKISKNKFFINICIDILAYIIKTQMELEAHELSHTWFNSFFKIEGDVFSDIILNQLQTASSFIVDQALASQMNQWLKLHQQSQVQRKIPKNFDRIQKLEEIAILHLMCTKTEE